MQCLPFHLSNPQTCLFFSGFLGAYFFWEGYFSFHVRSVLGIPESCWGGEKGEPSRQWRAGEEQRVTLVIRCEELGEILSPSTGFTRDRGSSSSRSLLSKNTKPLNYTVQQCWELCGRGCLAVRPCCLALPGRLSLGQSPAAWLRSQLSCRGRWHSEGLCLQAAVQIPCVFLQGWEQIHLWEVILCFLCIYFLVYNVLLTHWLIMQSPLFTPDYFLVWVTLQNTQHILSNEVSFLFVPVTRTAILAGKGWWLHLELWALLSLQSLELSWGWGATWMEGLWDAQPHWV